MQWRLTSFQSFGFFASSTTRHCLVHLEHHTVPDKMEGVIRISRFFQMPKQFCWGSSVFQITETTDNLKIVCLYFSDPSVCKPVTWLLSVICSAPLSSVSMKRKIHQKRQTDTHTCWWCNFAHGQSRNENVRSWWFVAHLSVFSSSGTKSFRFARTSYFSLLCFLFPSLYFPGRSIPVSASGGWLGG